MLNEYNQAVGTLQPVEKKLLKDHIKTLREALEPGLNSYNWHSLGIKSFIDKCRKAIKDFVMVKGQVDKERDKIVERIRAIEEGKLVQDFDWQRKEDNMMDITEFYEFMETYRERTVNELY